jgi:hypothetical protein
VLTNFKRNTMAFVGCLALVLSGCGDGSTAPTETAALAPLTPASTPFPSPLPAPYVGSLLKPDYYNIFYSAPLDGISALELPSTGKPAPVEQRVYEITLATLAIFFTDFNYLLFGKFGYQDVPCSNGANGDLHCRPDGNYASSAFLKGVELLSRLPDKRELAHYFSVGKLAP